MCLWYAVVASQVFAAQGPSLDLFRYDRSQPLDVIEEPYNVTPTARVFRISFVSPGGGRVTGMLGVPTRPGPHAGVVLLHGAPGSAAAIFGNHGLPLVARGAVALAIDAPWVRRGGVPDLTVRDSVEQVQLMHDLQRAVDVLLAREDVDPRRIGYVGGSYGAAMGGLFVGIERRVAAAALFVPDGGLVAHFTHRSGEAVGPLALARADLRHRWVAAMTPIEPIRFIHLAEGTPLLFQNARNDQMVANDDAEALHAAAPEPKTVLWYDTGHGLSPQATRDRLAWLARHLGIDP
jgi:hypothetical protein